MRKCQEWNSKWQKVIIAVSNMKAFCAHSLVSHEQTMLASVVSLQFLSSNYAKIDLAVVDTWIVI